MFFKNNLTKENIMEILSKNWPLSLSELYKLITSNVSYQYLRQCVNELIEVNIVIKKGMKYELDLDWVKKINHFSKKTIENYKYNRKNNLFTTETTQIHINSLYELGHFMLEALECKFLENKDKEGFFCLLNHLWIPFADRKKQKRILSLLDDFNVVYTKNSFFDKILEKTCYQKNVHKIKYKDISLDYDFFVYNNCVFQIYLPKELLTIMDKLYSLKCNPFSKVADLFSMTLNDHPINIVIIRNPELAKLHREKVKKVIYNNVDD